MTRPALGQGLFMQKLQRLCDSVVNGDAKASRALTEEALAAGFDPLKLVKDCVAPARDEVGRRFEDNEHFLSELLQSPGRHQESQSRPPELRTVLCTR